MALCACFSYLLYVCVWHPGEKECVNAWLMFAGTTRLCVVVCEIITVLCPVTPKRGVTSGSKINDVGVSTLK